MGSCSLGRKEILQLGSFIAQGTEHPEDKIRCFELT